MSASRSSTSTRIEASDAVRGPGPSATASLAEATGSSAAWSRWVGRTEPCTGTFGVVGGVGRGDAADAGVEATRSSSRFSTKSSTSTSTRSVTSSVTSSTTWATSGSAGSATGSAAGTTTTGTTTTGTTTTGEGAVSLTGRSSRTSWICAMTSSTAMSPSTPPTSIDARISRTVSTIRSSTSVVCRSIARRPSRSWTRRFSPAWVTFSSNPNARKPLVPLMVWIVRKMLLSSSREPGEPSSATRSWSSWSRFS